MAFVAADASNRAEIVGHLIAIAEELALSPRVVLKVKGGYAVPDAVLDSYNGVLAPEAEVEAEFAAWAEEVSASDAPEPNLGDVRAWAVDNGIEVAPKGRIKQSVIDAYTEAHSADPS